MSTPGRFPAKPDAAVDTGRAALRRGELEDAQASFRAALEGRESAEAHEGLAFSSWYLGDSETALKAFERAYELYHSGGDRVSAARVFVSSVATLHRIPAHPSGLITE